MIIATPERREFLFNDVRDNVPFSMKAKEACWISDAHKPLLLQERLANEGITSTLRGCLFRFGDQNMPIAGLPPWLLRVLIPHFFLEVNVPETESPVLVDPALDAGLGRSGICIQNWDGKSPMRRLAFLPHCYLYPDGCTNAVAVEEHLQALLMAKRAENPDAHAVCAAVNTLFETCRAATRPLEINPSYPRIIKDCHA